MSNQRSKKDQLSSDCKERLDALGFVWDPLPQQWEKGFRKLQEFQKREGHCNVKQGHEEDGFKLAVWIISQRTAKNKLPPAYKERLDGLGFVWDPYAKAWEEGFRNLQQFYEREGHCKVTTSHKEDGFNLGAWVSSQRGKKDQLSSDYKERLDGLGFVLNPSAEAWEEGFNKLQQFYGREGHCNVTRSHKEDGYALGRWVSFKKHNKSKQSPERIKRLDALGFVWQNKKPTSASKND